MCQHSPSLQGGSGSKKDSDNTHQYVNTLCHFRVDLAVNRDNTHLWWTSQHSQSLQGGLGSKQTMTMHNLSTLSITSGWIWQWTDKDNTHLWSTSQHSPSLQGGLGSKQTMTIHICGQLVNTLHRFRVELAVNRQWQYTSVVKMSTLSITLGWRWQWTDNTHLWSTRQHSPSLQGGSGSEKTDNYTSVVICQYSLSLQGGSGTEKTVTIHICGQYVNTLCHFRVDMAVNRQYTCMVNMSEFSIT